MKCHNVRARRPPHTLGYVSKRGGGDCTSIRRMPDGGVLRTSIHSTPRLYLNLLKWTARLVARDALVRLLCLRKVVAGRQVYVHFIHSFSHSFYTFIHSLIRTCFDSTIIPRSIPSRRSTLYPILF